MGSPNPIPRRSGTTNCSMSSSERFAKQHGGRDSEAITSRQGARLRSWNGGSMPREVCCRGSLAPPKQVFRCSGIQLSGVRIGPIHLIGPSPDPVRTPDHPNTRTPEHPTRREVVEAKLQELQDRLLEASDLGAAGAVLSWDQSTYMPTGGAAARARQLALLSRLAHEKFTDAAVGKLLKELRPYEESLPSDSDEASLIRVTRRLYEREVRVPPAFTAQLRSHGSAAYQAWSQARPADDFRIVEP